MYVDYGYMITFCCMCIYISVFVCLLRKGLGCALSLHYSFHGIFLGPALRGLYRCVCVYLPAYRIFQHFIMSLTSIVIV